MGRFGTTLGVHVLFATSLAAGCGGAPARTPTTPPAHAACTSTPASGGAHAEAAHPTSIADPHFIEEDAATMGFRLGRPRAITVTPDGDAVLFLRSGPRDFEGALFAFDPATGQERSLLTAAELLGSTPEHLSAEERERRERLRLTARGIASYELSADGKEILVPLSGRIFVFDRTSSQAHELPTGEGDANDAHFSPDGTHVAFVRSGDLYVIAVAGGREKRLTHDANAHIEDGLPEFVAQEEMERYRGYWWSPDSRRIAYQQTDTSGVETLYAFNPLHPEVASHGAPYPRAGHPNAKVALGIVRATGGPTRWIGWDRDSFPYLATVRWTAGAPLTLLVQNRRQTDERLLAVDADHGTTRTLLAEHDDAWINLDQQMPRFLDHGHEFLWTTERGGSFQLELHETRDGTLVHTVTPASFGYGGLSHVDEAGGLAWVRGGADPTETQLFRAPLDGSQAPVQVTHARGVHGATFGSGSRVWVHTASPVDGAPVATVMRGEEVVGPLHSVAETPPFVPHLTFETVGARHFHALVIRPRNFDPHLRYPVVVSVYGGPGVRTVRAVRGYYLREQWIADHGFIVVSADGRGTPGRGRAWERATKGDLIDIPLADQIAALRALGAEHPEMDLSRVGIYGWSFGGYFSAMAVLRRPDVFAVAVAGAPVTDWRDYDTHYTERYMGLPDDNRAGYGRTSLLTYAAHLARPLLLIHGTTDDNVYLVNSMALADALLRAGRPFDFLPLNGFTHMVHDAAVALALDERIAGFLTDHLKAPPQAPSRAQLGT